MAKSTFKWLETTPRPVTAERLKSVIQEHYREPHFKGGQTLTVTEDGWFEHDYTINKEGKLTNGTAVGIQAKDESNIQEFIAINLFVKIERMDINGDMVSLDPNECETRTQVGEKYTPKKGDVLRVISHKYQSMRNFSAQMFVLEFPKRDN